MKTKYSIALFFFAILIGAVITWYFASAPTPKEIMPPSAFPHKREAGSEAAQLLKRSGKLSDVIIIGIPPQPETYQEVVEGFAEMLASFNQPILILKEPRWPALQLSKPFELLDFDFNLENHQSAVELVNQATAQGKLVVIYTVSIFSTPLIQGNPLQRFQKLFGKPVTSITIGNLVLRQQGEHLNQPACIGSMRDTQGLYPLGCAQLVVSRKYYKDLLPLDQVRAALTKQSEHDYLLQVYTPEPKTD